MTTLDEVVGSVITSPQLLKLDVQGYEVEVLKGATRILAHTEVALLEVSLIEYNAGSPLFAEVIACMSNAGFAAYDICGYARRESDRALFQVDMLFVRLDELVARQKTVLECGTSGRVIPTWSRLITAVVPKEDDSRRGFEVAWSMMTVTKN